MHQSRVYSIAFRILGDCGAVEEAAQDVFLSLYRNLHRLQSEELVRPNGSSMGRMVADCDHGELDLVAMELNGTALSEWLRDPEQQHPVAERGNRTGD
ncbi:MAG: RNA polymerase sigma factor [Acidobacteriaceae bacterium]